MKNIKKLAASIATFTTVATMSIGSFSVLATTYDNCDVNRDGVVNVRDISAISRYREGNVYVPDYSQLDADKNLVINSMDEQCVLAKVMGYSYSSSYYSKKNNTLSNAPAVSEFVSSVDDSSTASRTYKRYDYRNNRQLSNYTLSPSTTPLSNSTQPRSIIGADDRYKSTGSMNTGIVYIVMDRGSSYQSNERYASITGFIVGDHQIATAAHGVYNGSWFTPYSIRNYNYNGTVSTNMFTPAEVHIPNSYVPGINTVTNRKYDYALITVEEDLSGYVQFDLGTSYSVNQTNYSDIPIYVTGRPSTTNTGATNSSNLLYTGEGEVVSRYISFPDDGGMPTPYSVSNNEVLFYSVDTTYGTSGAPVYTVTKNIINNQASYTYTAIAINSFESDNAVNGGALVTKYLLQFYKNNANANY